jgi:hypothetical protein
LKYQKNGIVVEKFDLGEAEEDSHDRYDHLLPVHKSVKDEVT